MQKWIIHTRLLATFNTRMARGMNKSLLFESQFDPIELVGTRVPFVDPFSYDVRAFQAVGFFSSECDEPRQQNRLGLSLSDDRVPAEEPRQAMEPDTRSMPLQRVPSIPPAGPSTFPEPRPVVAASGHGDRNRLTPEQAIHIYNLREYPTGYVTPIIPASFLFAGIR